MTRSLDRGWPWRWTGSPEAASPGLECVGAPGTEGWGATWIGQGFTGPQPHLSNGPWDSLLAPGTKALWS